MVRFFSGLLLVFVCYLSGSLVLAATQDTSINMQVGLDTDPPTTPVLTSATPVSDDQIDLVWDPSTDDFALAGYTVERDGSHIATTTLTTYSDTGLLSSTTYSYLVRAFDTAGNISSSSNAIATTTLATPVTPPAATTSSSSASATTASGKLSLRGGLSWLTTATSAQFWWETNRPSRYVLRWGRTPGYELGAIATERYQESHEAFLTDLAPNTTYYYELAAYNPAVSIAQILKSGTFKTKSVVKATAPQNVSRLQSTVSGEDVLLTWKNPEMAQGYTVRVVRSHLGYPADPYDGMVIAQGRIDSWWDVSALRTYRTQFYTVFVVDDQGNVSSGALTVARAMTAEDLEVASSSESLPVPMPPDIVLPLLDPHQIIVVQGEVIQTFENETLTLDPDLPLTLSIPTAALPARLKSIIVTLTDPTDSRQSYRFLLRRNETGDAYETTLAPLLVQGRSLLLIEVFDLEAQMVGRYGRQVNFVEPSVTPEVVFPDVLYRHWIWLVGFLLLLVMVVYVVRWYRRLYP